jgi:hypothetical protein
MPHSQLKQTRYSWIIQVDYKWIEKAKGGRANLLVLHNSNINWCGAVHATGILNFLLHDAGWGFINLWSRCARVEGVHALQMAHHMVLVLQIVCTGMTTSTTCTCPMYYAHNFQSALKMLYWNMNWCSYRNPSHETFYTKNLQTTKT